MKKITKFRKLVFLLLLSISSNAFGQILLNTNDNLPKKCGFDELHKEKLENDPEYLQKTLQFELAVKNFVPNKSVASYKIPVVVHVMETGTALTAITDQQIKDAILTLNQRLRKVTGTLGDGNGVDVEIEYALAVRDPSGNCTNGINRFDMTGNATYMSSGVRRSTGSGITDAVLKSQIVWDQSEYYNIWLISEIDNNNGGSGIQGYAFFASSHGTANDGAVMLVNNMKNSTSTTLIHELGHSLNLYHTFEGDGGDGSICPVGNACGSGSGDCCADTPPHRQSSSDCVSASNACDGGSSSSLFINNYMDYSSDACQNMLTLDQRSRMQTAISTTRASFLESNGNMALIPVAASVVDFKASKTILCGTGQDIIFYDLSSCAPNTFMSETAWTGTSFLWSITNGTNTYTSTSQNPTINFANTGTFDVSLTLTTPIGTTTLTKNDYVVVSTAPTPLCTRATNNTGNFGQTISNVIFNTINNSTSASVNAANTDFTCTSNTIVEAGLTYSLSVTINATGGSGAEMMEAYIDYNNDGDIADAGELVLSGSTAASTSSTIVGNVIIPLTATQDNLLVMRIMGETTAFTNNERFCLANTFIGDREDYGVLITTTCIAPSITGNPADATICASDNVSFNSTANGDATLNFQWFEDSGSGFVSLSNTGVYSGTSTGTLSITGASASMNNYLYECHVTNSCGNAVSSPATLTVNSTVIAQGTTSNPTTCLGTDGSIEITGTGTGDLSYTGTASGSNLEITLPFTSSTFTAGTYDFTFNNGCTSNTISVTLTDPSAVVIAQGTTSNPTTCLGSDGSIEITGTGTGDLTYIGTMSGTDLAVTLPFTTSTFNAGTYDFTFNNGCTSNTISVTLTDPSAVVIAQGTTSKPTTCLGTDGSIQITGTGTGDLSYTGTASGSNLGITLPFTTSTFTAGTYDFTFNNGCTSNTISVTLTDPSAVVIAQGTTSNPTACLGSDGSIEITGTGTGDITWTGTSTGSVLAANLPSNITGFSAGTYDFTFNDGCASNTISVTLVDPIGIVIAQGTTSNPTTCLGTDGSIEITGTGTGDLSYTGPMFGTLLGITLPFTISTFTAGTYDFTFNDGCASNTISVTLADPSGIAIAQGTASNPTACLASDGSIEITGTGTGDISWIGTSIGSVSAVTLPNNITGFSAGTYDFTFNDGCASNTISVTLIDPVGIAIAQGTTSNPTTCLGSDGSIEITGTGTGDLSYTGTMTGTLAGINLPFTISTFTAGTYDFTFNDGCASNTVSVTLTDPSGIAIAQGTTSNPTTCLGSDGSIEITGTGTGDLSYTGTMSGTDLAVTLPFTTTTFTAGTYDFTFNDGCASNTISVTLTDPSGIAITQGTTSNPTVCLGTDGSIEITGTGTGDLSYIGTMSGSNLGITLPFATSGLTAGTYDFTFNNGCTSNTISVTLTDPIGIAIAQGTILNPTICAASDGEIEISGIGTGDISWTGTTSGSVLGVNLPNNILGFSAGTYNFTFNNGCNSNTISVSLSDPGAPATPTITPSGPTTFCGGSITLTSSSANDNVWSTGETTQSIVVSTSNTYSVFVSTAGCNSGSVSEIITVDAMPALPIITASGLTTFCLGGSVNLTSSSAINNLWSTGETTQTITVSAGGNYTVAVTSGTCTNTSVNEVITVIIPTTISAGTLSEPSTCGNSDGSTEILDIGFGTGDLSWTGTSSGNILATSLNATFSGFSAGTYDFTFNDGCPSNTISITFTDPAGSTISQGTTSNPTVCLGSDGSIEITGTGTGDLSYTGTMSGTDFGVTLPFSSSIFSAGTYDFTFNDGCISNTINVTLNNPSSVISQGSTSNPTTCLASDGSIEITGTGTGDLSYTGTMTGTDLAVTLPFTTSTFTAGTYDFTFNDGCTSNTVTVTLIDPTGIIISQGTTLSPTSCLGSDGEIEISGTGTGDISWTGTTTGSVLGVPLPNNISGFSAGTYDFTFNDGCISNTLSVTITDPIGGTISQGAVLNPFNCLGSDGEIEINGSGTGDISWTGTSTGSVLAVTLPNNIIGFSAGTYDFTFNDGCISNTISITLNDPTPVAISQGFLLQPPVCGSTNGEITVLGTGSGFLSWTGTSSGTISVILPVNVINFAAGTYDLTLLDANSCTSNTLTVSLSDPGVVTPTISASGPLSFCSGGNVVLTSSSLVDNVWSTGETTQSITVSTAGTYSVMVSSGACNSAAVSEVVTINPVPVIASANLTNPISCGSSTGSAEITGTGTGDLSWTGTTSGSNLGVTLPFTANGLGSGTYNFTFTANGCASNTESVSLADPGAPAQPTIILGGGTSFCGTGSVVLESSSPTDNLWSTGETTNIITFTASASTTVTLVLNVAGCSSSAAVENITVVPQPAVPTITASGTTTFCAGGSVTLTSSSPTTNLWSTGETTASITVISGGTYTVTESNFLCTATSLPEIVTVNPVETISLGLLSDASQCGLNDGSVEIIGTMTGDLILNGPISNTNTGITLPFTIGALSGGNYDVTFDNGCTSNTLNFTINQNVAPAVPTISASGITTFCDGGSVILTSSSAVNNLWSTGETTQSISVTASGNYNVTVTDGLCSEISTDEIVVVNPVPATPTITASGTTTFCDGGSVVLTSSSAIDNVWSTGETTQSITVLTSDVISVSVLTNGCSSLISLDEIVTVNPIPSTPTITANGPTDFCIGDNVVLTSSSIGNNTWSTGETTDFITVSNSGTYNVTVSNGFCSASSTDIIINVNSIPTPTPIITASNVTTFCQGGNVVLTSSSATNNTWSTGATTQAITVSASGNYDVTVNVGGCLATSLAEVITVNPIPATPVISASGPTTICSGSSVILTSSALSNNNWTTGSNNQSISVSNSGSFSVTETTLGCSATSAPILITVNQTPITPLISVTGSTTFCEGGSVQLTSLTTSGITWSSGEVVPTIIVNNSGTFSVTVLQNGCSATSNVITVTENLNPVVTLTPFTDVCNTANAFALTNGLPAGGNYSVNGTVTSTFDPFFAFLGVNIIDYTLIDDNGCQGTASDNQNVLNCVDLEETTTADFTIYPNPTNSTITIKGELLNNIKTIEIRDELGRLVGMQELTIDHSINLSDLADGLYSIVLKGENFEKIERVQLIK